MKKINEIIGDAKTVAISGHLRPDGDCVGSCLSLYNYLKKNRPDLTLKVYLEFVDDKFKIIKNSEDIDTNGDNGTVFDLFIALDTASTERLGFNLPIFEKAKRTVCIDHHASNQGYADENYVVPEASSASEVLLSFLDKECMDISVAEPMYMGIAHDSGVFRFQSTTPTTMRIAAEMMEMGVDFNRILEETYYTKSYNQMMLTAEIQTKTVLCMDNKCIYGYCTSEMMKEYHVTVNDLDAVIASIRNVNTVEVAMFIYQLDEHRYKVSLRSKNYVDVSNIAVKFGGGGHFHASGFDVDGELQDIIDKVLEEIKAVMS